MKVITYQTPSGDKINLTPKQVENLIKTSQWPKNQNGEEYCTVYMGLHSGRPSVESSLASDVVAGRWDNLTLN